MKAVPLSLQGQDGTLRRFLHTGPAPARTIYLSIEGAIVAFKLVEVAEDGTYLYTQEEELVDGEEDAEGAGAREAALPPLDPPARRGDRDAS